MLWEELDDPVCDAGDVVIDVHACGLNHSDLDSRAGTSRWPFSLPWVLGAEFAGFVSRGRERGRGDHDRRPRDRVPAVLLRPLRRVRELAT